MLFIYNYISKYNKEIFQEKIEGRMRSFMNFWCGFVDRWVEFYVGLFQICREDSDVFLKVRGTL